MYDQEALHAGDEIIRLFDALAKTWLLAILNDSKNVGNNLTTSAVSIRIFCALSWYHKSRVVSVVFAFRDATTCTPGHGFVFFGRRLCSWSVSVLAVSTRHASPTI
jgi:hypothetical protein